MSEHCNWKHLVNNWMLIITTNNILCVDNHHIEILIVILSIQLLTKCCTLTFWFFLLWKCCNLLTQCGVYCLADSFVFYSQGNSSATKEDSNNGTITTVEKPKSINVTDMFSWKNLMNLFNVFDLRVAFSYIRENLGTLLSVSTSFCCDLFHFYVELYLQSKSWLLTCDSKKRILKWAFFRQNLFCFVLLTLT